MNNNIGVLQKSSLAVFTAIILGLNFSSCTLPSNAKTNLEQVLSQASPKDGLDPAARPAVNFDLSGWNLGIPVDRGDGLSMTISTAKLNAGYENSKFFYTAADGGMVFRSPVAGPKTSANTSYTRSELREMLRGEKEVKTKGVNANNWVFSSASSSTQAKAGGIDGNMKATLKIDHVTTTGKKSQQGRVIIGQIHANSNEPLRLYYRKLSQHTKGSIYFAHELASGEEQWTEMIGSKSSGAADPADGIRLGEKFSYEIDVSFNTLTIVLGREGKEDVVAIVDMTNSGYDASDKYQYFKAGVYNQNKSGDPSDYVQATFYSLQKTHN